MVMKLRGYHVVIFTFFWFFYRRPQLEVQRRSLYLGVHKFLWHLRTSANTSGKKKLLQNYNHHIFQVLPLFSLPLFDRNHVSRLHCVLATRYMFLLYCLQTVCYKSNDRLCRSRIASDEKRSSWYHPCRTFVFFDTRGEKICYKYL